MSQYTIGINERSDSLKKFTIFYILFIIILLLNNLNNTLHEFQIHDNLS